MKTEIVNVPGRGICILISDIEPKDFIHGVDNITSLGICGGPFTNIQVIADQIRKGRKIGAIKEVRGQTGWGLREAKEYMDKYMENLGYDSCFSPAEQYAHYNECANNFLRAHKPDDFLGDEEFKI